MQEHYALPPVGKTEARDSSSYPYLMGCSSEQPFFDDHLGCRLKPDQRSGDLPFVNAALRFVIFGVRWHERRCVIGW